MTLSDQTLHAIACDVLRAEEAHIVKLLAGADVQLAEAQEWCTAFSAIHKVLAWLERDTPPMQQRKAK